MNEETWLAVLQALPNSINTPLILFDNPIQALAWIQLNDFQDEIFWIVTDDERRYWVVTSEVGQQLLEMGFQRISEIPPAVPPQSSVVPGDEMA